MSTRRVGPSSFSEYILPVEIHCIHFLPPSSSPPPPSDNLFFSSIVCKYISTQYDKKIKIVNKTSKDSELSDYNNINLPVYVQQKNYVKAIFADKKEIFSDDLNIARYIARSFHIARLYAQDKKSFSFSSFSCISSLLIFGNIEHWVEFAQKLLFLLNKEEEKEKKKEEKKEKKEENNEKKEEKEQEELIKIINNLEEDLKKKNFLLHSTDATFCDLIMYTVLQRFIKNNKYNEILEKCNNCESIKNFIKNINTLLTTKMKHTKEQNANISSAGGGGGGKTKQNKHKKVQSNKTTNNLTNANMEGDIQQNTNFIKQIIEEDIKNKKHTKIITRFPPEPNGYLHLGHAKSLSINFGIAEEYKGVCHLRFDDTNPLKEEERYIKSIQEDIKWLGYDWGENIFYTSDYFDKLHEWAVLLIKKQLAYVDDQTLQEIRNNRGNILTPGTPSPYRERSVEENLDKFARMKAGEYEEGSRVLRAKIDMSSPNMNMRDPIIYRILKKPHPRVQNKWCIYPMYDFAHGQSDSIEKITHSICTLEFELHRPLYEWLQDKLEIFKTRQIEFARLNCTYTVMSKRKLLSLVEEGYVSDWDDPRMPTLSGLRRRGVPPKAIIHFCNKIGVAKRNTTMRIELLETCIRDSMNSMAYRCHGILRPLKVVISNFDENLVEASKALNHPNKPETFGSRNIYFAREIYIDADDFAEIPPPKFFRLTPGGEVRLKYAYWIKCNEVIKDSEGRVVELRCTYDPSTKGGCPPADGRKVKGVIHWIACKHAKQAEIRMYDRLFTKANPEEEEEEEANEKEKVYENENESETKANQNAAAGDAKSWRNFINKNSLKVYNGVVEEELCKMYEEFKEKNKNEEMYLQFERVGFFIFDKNTTYDKPIFNLTVSLVDAYENENLIKAKKKEQMAREKANAERKPKKNIKNLKKKKGKENEKEKESSGHVEEEKKNGTNVSTCNQQIKESNSCKRETDEK